MNYMDYIPRWTIYLAKQAGYKGEDQNASRHHRGGHPGQQTRQEQEANQCLPVRAQAHQEEEGEEINQWAM